MTENPCIEPVPTKRKTQSRAATLLAAITTGMADSMIASGCVIGVVSPTIMLQRRSTYLASTTTGRRSQ